MKSITTLLIITIFPVCMFAQKFSAGAGGGLIAIDNNNGFNSNLYLAYNLNNKIAIGADALFANGENNLKTGAYIAYVEAGSSSWSIDNKHIFYFSGIIGFGNIEEKLESFKKNAATIYVGTKINVNLNPKFIFGIKSGMYLSKLDYIPIMGNLFFTYKF